MRRRWRISALRWRIARWMVGPFVTLPDRQGAWIVMRFDGGSSVTFEADKLRLKRTNRLPSFDFDPARIGYVPSGATGRFVGTLKP